MGTLLRDVPPAAARVIIQEQRLNTLSLPPPTPRTRTTSLHITPTRARTHTINTHWVACNYSRTWIQDTRPAATSNTKDTSRFLTRNTNTWRSVPRRASAFNVASARTGALQDKGAAQSHGRALGSVASHSSASYVIYFLRLKCSSVGFSWMLLTLKIQKRGQSASRGINVPLEMPDGPLQKPCQMWVCRRRCV